MLFEIVHEGSRPERVEQDIFLEVFDMYFNGPSLSPEGAFAVMFF